jgi:hypothetical protein
VLTTTWDGRVRVMYLPDKRMQLRMNLLTVEASVAALVRAGLSVGFVSGQAYGPPVSIAARLRDDAVPPDVSALLGARLGAVVRTVRDGPGRVRWERLDLSELDELAAAWAPYRMTVLARQPDPDPDLDLEPSLSRPLVGRWAGGLWTWLGATDLRAALAAHRPRFGDVRGEPPEDRGDSTDAGEPANGILELPADLAAAAGVWPELTWERSTGTVLLLVARPVGPAPAVRLLVGMNEGHARWFPFAATPTGDALAVALDPADVRDGGGLRFRTEPVAGAGEGERA